MLELTHAFLNAYEELMEGVQDAIDMRIALADWLHYQSVTPLCENVFFGELAGADEQTTSVAAIIEDLNADLMLPPPRRFSAHIPTAAVGDFSGLILVSANPLVHFNTDLAEHNYRTISLENNQQFCTDLSKFQEICGGGAWWSHAIKFSHLYTTGSMNPIPANQRWSWLLFENNGSGIGNIDLLPFHSPGDGFGLLVGPHPTKARLRQFALSTLKMILRVSPEHGLIFVGSALGANLVAANFELLGLHPVPPREDEIAPYTLLGRFQNGVTGARVMTFPYQICTGWFNSRPPEGFSPVGLASRMRDFAGHP